MAVSTIDTIISVGIPFGVTGKLRPFLNTLICDSVRCLPDRLTTLRSWGKWLAFLSYTHSSWSATNQYWCFFFFADTPVVMAKVEALCSTQTHIVVVYATRIASVVWFFGGRYGFEAVSSVFHQSYALFRLQK